MSWVTIAWSMAASACLTLALMHCFIWYCNRGAVANLLFAATAVGAAMVAACELAMVRAETPAAFALALRLFHVPVWVVVLSLAAFVQVYLRAGKPWLAWTVCLLRTVSLLANFLSGENLNYKHVTRLIHIPFLGEYIAVAEGVRNPWMLIGQLSLLLLVLFVADAALTDWRRGNRKRSLTVGGSIVFLVSAGAIEAAVVFQAGLNWPMTATFFYLGLLGAMAHQLTCDAIRAPRLDRALQASEQHVALAAKTANLGIWTFYPDREEIVAKQPWRDLHGLGPLEPLNLHTFLARVYPEDRISVQQTLAEAVQTRASYQTEYRTSLPGISLRWIAMHGSVQKPEDGESPCLQGIAADITPRKQAEAEAQSHRNEVAHLLRVATLGGLSAAIAHELNQPLTAILMNAQAAQRLMAQGNTADISEILNDIVADDQRAKTVVHRLRRLMQKGEFQAHLLNLNEVIHGVLRLMSSELEGRGILIKTHLAPGLPQVRGDVVHLQQVLINLVLNACESMSSSDPAGRTLTVASELAAGGVQVSVADTGTGFPAGDEERIFEPYHSTKAGGLGLGLWLSNSLMEAHGGRLWAENQPSGGAVFRFTLPASIGQAA